MDDTTKLQKLYDNLEKLYTDNKAKLLFHGWHHIVFVRNKAKIFATSISANSFLAESAALVHDLNYLVKPNSEPQDGEKLRKEYLMIAGYTEDDMRRIENIVLEEHTATRGKNISNEGKALSDADTLFKSLPITPILFASKFIQENDVDIKQLASKICSEQNKLLESDIYFYTDLAKENYLKWAKANLQLWNNVEDALKDNDVEEMISIAKRNGVI